MSKPLGFIAVGLVGGLLSLLWLQGLQALNGRWLNVDFATGSDSQRLQIIDLVGTPGSGRLNLSLDASGVPNWWRLEWQWCPRLNPLQWCVALSTDGISGTARVSPELTGLRLYEGSLNMHLPPQSRPLAGIMIVDIHRMHWQPDAGRWLLQQLPEINVGAHLQQLTLFGQALQPMQLALARESAGLLSVQVSGREVNGTIDLDNDYHYRTQLVLSPSTSLRETLGGALSLLLGDELQSQPNGGFALNTAGEIVAAQRW